MSYQISWNEAKTAVYMKASGAISEEDVRNADTQMLRLLAETGEDQIHAIIDDTEMQRMPGVATTMRLEALKHPRFGWTVVVGQRQKVYRMLYTITCHLRGLPLYLADTPEEAADFMAKTTGIPAS